MSLPCLEPIRLSVSVELTAQVITSLKALFRLHLAPTHYFSTIPYLILAPWVPAIPVSLFSPTWQRNTCLTYLHLLFFQSGMLFLQRLFLIEGTAFSHMLFVLIIWFIFPYSTYHHLT